jgi:SOS response associated peptidase (SRAP)
VGSLPHWAKDSKIAFKMINARAETLTEKPAYRSLIGKYRCLIPADGFYEWTVGSDGKKQPIHFHLPGYDLFAFAPSWKPAAGGPYRRVALLSGCRSMSLARSSSSALMSWPRRRRPNRHPGSGHPEKPHDLSIERNRLHVVEPGEPLALPVPTNFTAFLLRFSYEPGRWPLHAG